MYEPPEWFNPVVAANLSTLYPEISLMTIYGVAGTLGVVERRLTIPKTNLQIFEFGSGAGEGLVSLDMFAKARPVSKIVGSERINYLRIIAKIVSKDLQRVASVIPDGMSELESGDARWDIVLANMFGPSYFDHVLPSKFIPAALSALKPGGCIIINSDPDTMENVENCARDNLRADQINLVTPDVIPMGYIALPHLFLTR